MKKVLSVFLSVLLVFSTFGAVLASAATETEAKADAYTFNEEKAEIKFDDSKLNTEDIEKLIDALDPKVAELLKNNVGNIYTDEMASKLIAAIGGKLLSGYREVDLKKTKELFGQEAYDYLAAAKKNNTPWNELGTIPFGIKNEKQFIDAASVTLAGVGQLAALLILGTPAIFNDNLIPMIEAFHMDTVPFVDAANPYDNPIVSLIIANSADMGWATLEAVLPYVTHIINAVLASDAPLSYILNILPDFVAHYDAFAKNFGFLKLPAFDKLLGGLLAKVGVVNAPEFDVNELIHMATPAVVESGSDGGYTMQLNGDKDLVFAFLLNYVADVLADQDNILSVGKTVVTNFGVVADTYDAFADAIKANHFGTVAEELCNMLDEVIEANKPAEQPMNFFMTLIQKLLQLKAKILNFFNELFKS